MSAPTIAGSGRRLLDGLPAIRLESIRSTTSPTGYLLVDYRVIGSGVTVIFQAAPTAVRHGDVVSTYRVWEPEHA